LTAESGVDPHFRVHALSALATACYIYTGHIVPLPLRLPLLATLSRLPGTTARTKLTVQSVVAHVCKRTACMLAMDEAFGPCIKQLSAQARARVASGGSWRNIARVIASEAASWLCSPTSHPRHNDGVACDTVYHVNATLIVRGIGLVSSAYGMLHCRVEVARLVARWRAGPCKDRLIGMQHVLVAFEPCVLPDDQPSGAAASRAEARVVKYTAGSGRADPTTRQ
jgi:hypothetical protein